MGDPADPRGMLEPDAGVEPVTAPTTSGPAGLPAEPRPEGSGLVATREAAASSAGVSRAPAAGTQLETTHGRTTIADAVVARTAAHAARTVHGVHSLGKPVARAVAGASGRIAGARAASAPGVTVEIGDQQTTIDVALVVDYGAPVAPLARVVRAQVTHAVEVVTGLAVLEVNIDVVDLHQPTRTGDRDT